jgi:hypothetical protein
LKNKKVEKKNMVTTELGQLTQTSIGIILQNGNPEYTKVFRADEVSAELQDKLRQTQVLLEKISAHPLKSLSELDNTALDDLLGHVAKLSQLASEHSHRQRPAEAIDFRKKQGPHTFATLVDEMSALIGTVMSSKNAENAQGALTLTPIQSKDLQDLSSKLLKMLIPFTQQRKQVESADRPLSSDPKDETFWQWMQSQGIRTAPNDSSITEEETPPAAAPSADQVRVEKLIERVKTL